MIISQNIKKYRLKLGITQKQLADRLNVSVPAVCKWEAGDSNPDITQIIPLAKIFNISTDDLLGFSQGQENSKIEKIINDYERLIKENQIKNADKLIAEAYLTYPNDYMIMNEYMWSLVGGRNMKNRDGLLESREIIEKIIDRIFSGCEIESVRLDALLMSARLKYSLGSVNEALHILENIPRLHESREPQIELLYEPDSYNAIYWTKRNMYKLADALAFKMTKAIWNEKTCPDEIRISKLTEIAEKLYKIWDETKEVTFLLMSHMFYATIINKILTFNRAKEEIFYLLDKQLNAAGLITDVSKSDEALQELLLITYKTSNVLEWTIKKYKFICNESGESDYHSIISDLIRKYESERT